MKPDAIYDGVSVGQGSTSEMVSLNCVTQPRTSMTDAKNIQMNSRDATSTWVGSRRKYLTRAAKFANAMW